jgi:hypothetical protein
MAEDYSETLRATMMDYGAYQGDPEGANAFNRGVVSLFDAAINGRTTINIGSATLFTLPPMTEGEAADSQYYWLRIIGTPSATVTLIVPGTIANKQYLFSNETGQVIGVKYVATPGVLIPNGMTVLLQCDGIDVRPFTLGYGGTPAEATAGSTIGDGNFQPGYIERYGNNLSPGVTDMSSALAAANAQAVIAGGDPIRVATMVHFDAPVTITGPFDAVPGKQIFSATSQVTFAAGSVPAVYPDWWGPGVGALNKAVAAVTGKYIPVRLLAKTYAFSTGIALANRGDAIIGPRRGNATAGGTYAGAVLHYTGTSGTAILCGISPVVNGSFLDGLELGGFTLRVTETTDIALRLWHCSGLSHVHDLVIRGNSDNDGSDNVGMQVDGCVDTDIERVLIFGTGALGGGATLVQYGLKVVNGFGGQPTLTTRFRQCYIDQCNIGANVADDSEVAFDHCAFTGCYGSGLLMQNNARALVTDPYVTGNGANGDAPVRLLNSTSLQIAGGKINIGTAQYFFGVPSSSVALTMLGNLNLVSSNANPRLLSLASAQPVVDILGQNSYPANISDSDTAITRLFKITASIPKLPVYTVGGVPSAAAAGQLVYISNESGGAVLAFTDGANWRRVTDRAVIS